MPSAEEKERQRRHQILESQQFHQWWENRRTMQPTPSNPYQAFMIDRSLKAKNYDEKSWSDYRCLGQGL